MPRIQVVCQVGICALGFDEPRLHVDCDMKPTRSLADWLQRRGRTARAYPMGSGDRSYQMEMISRNRIELSKGRNPLDVAPCGSGKSWLACKTAQLATEKNKSIGFVTVRRGLVADISRRLTGFGVPHGIQMAGCEDNDHPTKVVSIHTAIARGLTLNVSCLFLDEGHLFLSEEFQAFVNRHRHIPRVVLTASPWNASGFGLHRIADSIVLGPTPQFLIDAGFLVPTRIFTRHVPDVAKCDANKSGEFNEEQLSTVMSRPAIVGDCVKEWLLRANGLPTIVHSVNRKHSELIAKKFEKAGVNAVCIDANTADAERARVFDDMCRDAPPKPYSLLLDLAGNCVHFGFPEDEREWSLADHDPKKPHASALSVRRCDKCWFTYRAHSPKCPECGNAYAPTQRRIREKREELVELKREIKEKAIENWRSRAGDDTRREKFRKLVEEGRAKGWKPYAAIMRYQAIFKEEVPQEWKGDAFRRTPAI